MRFIVLALVLVLTARNQEQTPKQRCTFSSTTFSSVLFSSMPGPPTSSVGVDGVDIVPGMGSNVGNVMSTNPCGVHEAVCRGVVHSEELPRNCAHYLVPII